MAKSRSDNPDFCSFCGKSADQVGRLIAGPPGVFICNECVDVCGALLNDERGRNKKKKSNKKSKTNKTDKKINKPKTRMNFNSPN